MDLHHVFFIQSSVDGHLACSHTLAIINNAVMNTRVRVSFQISVFVFLGYMPKSGIARSYGISICHFFVKLLTVFHSGYTSLASHQQCTKGSLFSTSSSTFVICVLFADSHSDRCEVISHCSFNLQFPHD